MKKISSIITILLIGLSIVSCGKKNEIIVNSDSTILKGDLQDYFEVVNNTYKIERKEYKGKFDGIKLKVQIKKKDVDFNISPKPEMIGFECELLDENKTPIGSILKDHKYDSDIDKLIKLKTNETIWIEFYINTIGIKEDEVDKIKTFSLNSILKLPETNSISEQQTNDSDSVESSSDCDKFITDYEEFVTDYIKVLKKYKANPSDTSILTEYTELAQKASEMQSKASDCTDPKYATKLMQLASKIAKAGM